ncbi:MAG: GNAT family N-acetyltransferase [Flavobacteriaceae bacterium]
MKLLKGNNIYLRALEPEDLDFLESIENDTSLWEISGTVKPFSRDVLKAYIKNAKQDINIAQQFRFVICDTKTKKTAGLVDLFDFDAQNKRVGVGIVITAQYRRKGFANDALKTLINYCFKTLKLHQLYANILEDNTTSLKLFKNQRFEVVGLKKDWHYYKNNFKNEWLLQLLNTDV